MGLFNCDNFPIEPPNLLSCAFCSLCVYERSWNAPVEEEINCARIEHQLIENVHEIQPRLCTLIHETTISTSREKYSHQCRF